MLPSTAGKAFSAKGIQDLLESTYSVSLIVFHRSEAYCEAMLRTARANRATTSGPILWRSKTLNMRKRRPVCSGRPTLLWIDDYKPGLELYRAMFERLGFKVLTATSGQEALKIAAFASVDVVVTDYEMPGMNGETVAAAIKAFNPGVPVILFSGSTIVPTRVRRVVDAFCDKAGPRDQLSATIHRMLQKKRIPVLQPRPVAPPSQHRQRTVA